MDKKRLPEIENLFSFAMLLVVFGHSMIFSDFSRNPQWYLFARRVVYSFHMHLFFFISGFLFIYTTIGGEKFFWRRFIVGKINRLMMPYVILLSLAYLPRVYLSRYTTGQFDLSITSYFKMFVNPHYAPMYNYWFIFTLFVFFIFGFFFWKLLKSKNIWGCILVTILLSYMSSKKIDIEWFCLNYITGYMLYFWLGCLFYFFREKINQLSSVKVAGVLFLVLLLVNLFRLNVDGYMNVVSMLIRLSGIFFSYFLIREYTYSGADFPLFKFMNGFTFPIYLLSWFFHEGVAFFFNKQWGFGFYTVFPLSFVLAIACPVLIAKGVEKTMPKYRFIIGL